VLETEAMAKSLWSTASVAEGRQDGPASQPNPYEVPSGQEAKKSRRGVVSAFSCWRSRPRGSRADVIALGRCSTDGSAPHTYGGAVAMVRAVAESAARSRRPSNLAGPSCRPLPRGGGTLPCARESQGRGRRSTRPSGSAIVRIGGARTRGQATRRAPGSRPMCSGAFEDAACSPSEPGIARLIPSASSETAGSPAPLHDALRHVSTANAVARVSMSYPARAHSGATSVQALSLPCVRSLRARSFGPAGGFRQQRTAASEKAQELVSAFVGSFFSRIYLPSEAAEPVRDDG
jgi:hypothetical protein